MRMEAQERSLMAYFQTEEDARAAAEALRAAGFSQVRVDTLGDDPDGGVGGDDTGILLAADPTASGMAGTGETGMGGYNHLVTVVAAEDVIGDAEAVVRRYGGYA